METILEKEPVITNNSISSMSSDYAMDSEDIKGILQYASYFTYIYIYMISIKYVDSNLLNVILYIK